MIEPERSWSARPNFQPASPVEWTPPAPTGTSSRSGSRIASRPCWVDWKMRSSRAWRSICFCLRCQRTVRRRPPSIPSWRRWILPRFWARRRRPSSAESCGNCCSMRRTVPAAFRENCWRPRKPRWPRSRRSSCSSSRPRLHLKPPPVPGGDLAAAVLPRQQRRRWVQRRM